MRFTMNEIRRQSHNKRVDHRMLVRMLVLIVILTVIIIYFAVKFTPATP